MKMVAESPKEFYDRQYALHREGQMVCPCAVNDLAKARRRVNGIFRAFGIPNSARGGKVLDVGCGLGYYTKALSSSGADVTGLDFSETGIQVARSTFPECQFRHGAWHQDVEEEPGFDMIWAVNFSLLNTFDVEFINERFIAHALQRLRPNGCVVVGWNTNFSGRKIDNYSCWSMGTLAQMRQVCGLSSPRVAEAPTRLQSWAITQVSRILGKSVPIFMILRKTN
jgi:SAM-dependent methyltransferase